MTTDLRELKSHTDCRELLSADLGEPVRKAQDYWQWRCPLHPDGRTPSLTAWRDGWYCFGCGAHGDSVTWLTEHRGLAFKDAVQALGGDLPLPERRVSPRRTVFHCAPLREPPPKEWRADALRFVETAHEALLSPVGERARVWLAQRGITLEDVRLWRLGYIPADRKDRWGDVDVFLPRGIVIPCLVGGAPWYVKVRRPAGEPKYVHAKGGRSALFGADLLQGRPELLLTEGEFDAVLMHRLVGDVLDVATFGSASDNDMRLWLPLLVNYKRIWVGFDADEAGDKARSEWYERTKRAHGLIPPAKDWTDAWRELGDDELREYVLSACRAAEARQ